MSGPVPTPVVHDGRVIADPLLERALVAAIVRDPRLLAVVPDIGLPEFADPAAGSAWSAIRNLDPATINAKTVVSRLELTHGKETVVPNQIRALLDGDHGCTCPAEVIDLGERMMLLAARREQAIRDAERPAETRSTEYGPSLIDWLGDEEPGDDDSGDWHIRGLVAKDVIGFVGGDPKVGKTMLVEAWSIALAMGARDWCGMPIYGRKRVLVMPREDSERTTKARLWQLARGAGLARPHELADYLSIDPLSPLNLRDKHLVSRLERACCRFDVVFIDSFATSHTGDENSARDVAAALDTVRNIAIGTQTSVVLIHHYNGKGSPDDKRGVKHRLRGSSAIAGYARHIVGASRGPTPGTVEIASDGNLAFQVEPFVVRLASGTTAQGKKTLGYKLVGTVAEAGELTARDEVIAAVSAGDGFRSANAIAAEVGGNRKAALAAVRAELEPGGRLEYRDGLIVAKAGS